MADRDGRPERVADIMGNGNGSKRDCVLDTKAMAELGRNLFDFDWDVGHAADIQRMNEGKKGILSCTAML